MVISTSFFHGGQPIPQAGIYRVIHDPLVPKLTKSPASRQELSTLQDCADARFELVRAVSWVEEIGTPALEPCFEVPAGSYSVKIAPAPVEALA